MKSNIHKEDDIDNNKTNSKNNNNNSNNAKYDNNKNVKL